MIFEFGRIFLEAYNAKHNTRYTPREFFREVYWPIFFNDEKLLLYVSNSPFVQHVKAGESEILRLERLDTLDDDLTTKTHHAGTAPGYPALGVTGTTSGQVSQGIGIPDGIDEAYLSWIAAGLSVCVEGGTCILFYDADILLRIAEGWQGYRDFVNANDTEGRQINIWNTYHLLGIELGEMKGGKLPTVPWSQVAFYFAKQYPGVDQMMGFGYLHGQTNTTFGWIPFDLTSARLLRERYVELFGEETADEAELFFGTMGKLEWVFQRTGCVGVWPYEPDGAMDKSFKYSAKKEILWKASIAWLSVVLGSGAETMQQSEQIAQVMRTAAGDHYQLRADALKASDRVKFMDAVIKIMELDIAKREVYEAVMPVILLDPIPFRYMLSMIRLQNAKMRK